MFKYGSFKLFFIKFVIGSFFLIFSIFLLGSLITYSPEDPGFKKIVFVDNIQNAFGYFGAQLSSIMIVFWGHASYLIFLFFLITGLKLILGVNSARFIIRSILLLVGIICVNFFLQLISFDKIVFGLLPIFFYNLLFQLFLNYTNNYFFLYSLGFVVFVIGLLMLIYSLNIRLKFISYSLVVLALLDLYLI